MEEIKNIIAKNIASLRASKNMTQAELAEMLNYTDKSVSKWEHGDTTPPIEILKNIADIFDVTLDFLVTENTSESYDKIYNSKQNKSKKGIITALSVIIIWTVAVVLYAYGMLLANLNLWIIFVVAVPVSCIDLIVFNGIWGKRKYTFILISVLIWSILASIYLLFVYNNPWMIFIIGVPVQMGTILWAQLKPNRKK